MAIGVGVNRLKKLCNEKNWTMDSALCRCVEDTNPELEAGPIYEDAIGEVGEEGIRKIVSAILKEREQKD